MSKNILSIYISLLLIYVQFIWHIIFFSYILMSIIFQIVKRSPIIIIDEFAN